MSHLSLDPSTHVGAVLKLKIHRHYDHIIPGVNRLPRGIKRDLATMPRDEKLDMIVHAEMDALMTAAKHGYATANSTLYLVAYDVELGGYWGSAPCTNCGKHVIAAGIQRVVTVRGYKPPYKWIRNCEISQGRLQEAGIAYEEIPYDALNG